MTLVCSTTPQPPWPYRVAAAKAAADEGGNHTRYLAVLEQAFNEALSKADHATGLINAALDAAVTEPPPKRMLIALLRLSAGRERAGNGFAEPVTDDELEWVASLLGGPVDGAT